MAARERELIEIHGNKRYVRRDTNGRFTSDQVTAGSSLRADRRQHAKRTVPAGQGDRGDQERR